MSRDRDDREDFASRWSRRKRAAKAPPAEPEAATKPEAAPAEETRSDQEILDELGLPDPDALKPGDDVSAFMAGAVPARLRNRALRRLWATNPLLANLDGLIDYGEDFTNAATVPEVLNTAYRVGRGWAEDDEEGAAGEAPNESAETGAPSAGEAPRSAEAGQETADRGGEEAIAGQGSEAATDAQATEARATEAQATEAGRAGADSQPRPRSAADAAPRRRMRFRFSDG